MRSPKPPCAQSGCGRPKGLNRSLCQARRSRIPLTLWATSRALAATRGADLSRHFEPARRSQQCSRELQVMTWACRVNLSRGVHSRERMRRVGPVESELAAAGSARDAPVFSSQPQAPRCVIRTSIPSASVMHLRLGCLDSSPTKPTPQASLSTLSCKRPSFGGCRACASTTTSRRTFASPNDVGFTDRQVRAWAASCAGTPLAPGLASFLHDAPAAACMVTDFVTSFRRKRLDLRCSCDVLAFAVLGPAPEAPAASPLTPLCKPPATYRPAPVFPHLRRSGRHHPTATYVCTSAAKLLLRCCAKETDKPGCASWRCRSVT